VYAGSGEINQYFNDFAAKYDLDRYVQRNHQVVGAQWDDKNGQWTVEVLDLVSQKVTKDTCHILINASGILNAWKWPAIPGIANYKGNLLHSANWDDSVQLEGKHVGLIGNGYACRSQYPPAREVPQLIVIQIIWDPNPTRNSAQSEKTHYFHPGADLGIPSPRTRTACIQ
jgi:hypothetical protein